MYIRLIKNERQTVTDEEGKEQPALRLQFKNKELWILPVDILWVVEWDDKNVIKQAREAAKFYFKSL